jgi:uncharacterized phage protein (TIGR02218 family)
MRKFSDVDLERLMGSTSLCHCWKLSLKNGTTLAFTDHDRDLTIENMIYRSANGLTGSEVEHALGFAVGGSEISGALTSDIIKAEDIDAGLYDGASVETWWVDWERPTLRALLDAGTIGEIRRTDIGFTAEIRSLAQIFETPNGRFFSRLCSAQFGDSKCKAESISFSSTLVQSITDYDCYIAPVDLPADSLVGGYMLHRNTRFRIRQHLVLGDKHYLRFWTKSESGFVLGESVEVHSACNKTREMCEGLYRNCVNFRGFPLMPPAEQVLLPADASTQPLDGGSLL